MQLFFPNGTYFATGAAHYKYRPATNRDTTNRIILRIEIAGSRVDAVLDTGAPYAILPIQVAEPAGFSPASALSRETILIRGVRFDGSIVRLNMKLVATLGTNLDVDATVFVPDSEEYEGNFPSFIGLTGVLERIRFAVDPVTDTFYFGSLTEN